jgi:L-ornithine Nalpha-acyltransferase
MRLNPHGRHQRLSPVLMRNLTLSLAETIADLRAVQRTRYVSFQEENGIPIAHDPRVRRDVASGDTSETTRHVMVCDQGRCVATARLSLGDPDLAEAPGHRFGFEMEADWDLRALEPLCGKLVEVSRLAVLREYWPSNAAFRLYEGITVTSLALGKSHLIGAVDCRTDQPDDARIMQCILAARGHHSFDFSIPTTAAGGKSGAHPGVRTDFYSAEQRARALDGDIAELPVSHPLAALTKHLGARCIGGPARHPSFPRMVLPVLVDLCALPARTVARFEPPSQLQINGFPTRRAS